MAERTNKQNKALVVIIATVAATGGLLFGFDTGVISGAIPFFQKTFGIADNWVEIITTAGLVGAVIGAMSSGRIADIIGRKKVILASAVIFSIKSSPYTTLSNVVEFACRSKPFARSLACSAARISLILCSGGKAVSLKNWLMLPKSKPKRKRKTHRL